MSSAFPVRTARRRRRRQDPASILGTVLIVLALAAVSFFVLLPVLWMISASFRTNGDLASHPGTLWSTSFTLDNYLNVWSRIPLAKQFLNTIVFAGSVTVLSVLIDGMAGYALARFRFRGQTVLFVAIIATLIIPIQATFIPVYNLLVDLHWLNTFHGLVLPRIADAFGIFFFRQFFLALPKDLEDAARIDGASEFRIFARIMFPLASPAVLTIGMFNLLANWNDLLWPLLVTTNDDMRTLPAGLALFKGQHSTDYGMLMAGGILALLPMVIAFVIVQRRFIAGIATTGMK
ncbi:MAG: carbohydrate ABC transporter permease [Actinomycetales bacterium]|nr:carbohydrate ABC transporter permease [Actinomycetales bacterium]